MQRPGYTEMTLLVLDDLMRGVGSEDQSLKQQASSMINWLFTTSGFYDKSVKGSYFDIDVGAAVGGGVVRKFLELYENSLRDSDCLIGWMVHDFVPKKYNERVKEYGSSLAERSRCKYPNHHHDFHQWYELIEGKKVLVVNGFAELMVEQYEIGNVKKIYKDFPEISCLMGYTSPYTFFNDGPRNNYFETLEDVFSEIMEFDSEVVIIGFGAYACPLAHKLHLRGKTAISIGHRIHRMWGVDPQEKENPLWLSEIPEKYKPEGYEKIEGGRYWKRI
jgi:hypothetical protein